MNTNQEKYSWSKLAEEGKKLREHLGENPNDIAVWLESLKKVSTIPIPKTKLLTLTDEYLGWLTSDYYTEERIMLFNDYLIENLKDDFDIDNLDVFIKTGTYSNKFDFENPHVTNKKDIGKKFLEIFYSSMMVGAGTTPTVAVREYIKPKEDVPTIYHGMPLRREIRFFVDFDKEKILGYSEYWDKSQMKELARRAVPSINVEDITTKLIKNIQDLVDSKIIASPSGEETLKDFLTWAKWSKKLPDIECYVQSVLPKIKKLVFSKPLRGRWSVDIMFNDIDEPWLIDMALMHQSALVDVMQEL